MEGKDNKVAVCPTGEHKPMWDPNTGTTVCLNCGRSAGEIVNELGHALY